MNEELQGASQEAQAQPKPRTRDDILNDLKSGVASIQGGLAKELAEMVENNPELEDLFFEDKEAFFKKIIEFQDKVVNERIVDRQNELEEFDKNAQFESGLQALEQAKKAFQEAHPDVNADELMQFYLTLPQDVQAQLDSLAPDALFEKLFELYQAQGGAQQGQQDQLPKQLNGMPSDASELEPELDLPTTRY